VAYSHNISALLLSLVSNGALAIDLEDEIQAGVVITFDGKVVHPPTATPLAEPSATTTVPVALGAIP